jgi:hypothetical protein
VTRLVPIHNPHPDGTYIWFSVPDGCVITAEAEGPAEAPEPEPEAEQAAAEGDGKFIQWDGHTGHQFTALEYESEPEAGQ